MNYPIHPSWIAFFQARFREFDPVGKDPQCVAIVQQTAQAMDQIMREPHSAVSERMSEMFQFQLFDKFQVDVALPLTEEHAARLGELSDQFIQNK